MRRKTLGILMALPAVAAAFLAAPAMAQDRDEYGDVRQTVARISYVNGDVSFARGDDPDDWQAADRNVPMTLGDRIYTGSRSRIELQVHGGDIVRLGARTDLAALNLTDDTKQFSMRAGIASFRVRNLSQYDIWEVDTPNSAVTFEAPGDYRIDVDTNGDTRVFVRQGRAAVASAGSQIPVERGQGIEVYGVDRPQYDYVRVSSDSWDEWVGQRESRYSNARSHRYISADIVGADDLDEYGRWEQVPQYGWAWTPTSMQNDWAPYRVGHWIWQDPWGWTWVSTEPWGWAPYHYGRWVNASSRWYWIPVAPAVRYVTYSPALVAFSGGGPGWSLTVSSGGGGFIGWFPLGPRDPFNPWWGSHSGPRTTTVTNVTYINRNYITVVNRNAFVSGTPVGRAWVHDRTVVNQVVSAPVLRGPIPALPTAASLRVAVTAESRSVLRPPAAIVARSVVVRAAPPPAPPTFQAKLGVITRNQGAPVEAAAAARISVENRGRPQTVTEVRSVAAQPGQVTLAPRSAEAGERGKRPEPISAVPFRGRAMATAQQPVATSPENAAGPSRETAPRQVPAQPQQGQPETGQERGRRAPAPESTQQPNPPSAPPASVERGRPQPQEQSQREQEIQNQQKAAERQRVEQQQQQENQQKALERQRVEQQQQQQQENQQKALERRRIEQQQQQQQQEIQKQQLERRRIEQQQQQQQQQQQEIQKQKQERQRIEQQQQQQQQPPPQPPQGSERRRVQEPTPQPDNPRANPQGARGREAAPPQQQQQQTPPQQPAQQPQAQRGRQQPTPPEAQKDKEKDKEKEKNGKKEERGRQPQPTPTS